MADLTLEVALSHKAPHQTGHSRLEKKTQKFDETKHPREPGGSSEGGQFTETGHAGEATPHPALARQAQEGIAAVEKLIPEAIRTAEIPKEDLDGVSWATVDQATRTEVEQKHREFALKEWNWVPGTEMPAKLAAIQDTWGGFSEQDKTNLMNNYVISGQITRRGITAQEPTEWVTGVVESDGTQAAESNYERTHAIALRLTELRTEQLREERGLFEEDQGEHYQPRKIVSTEFLIEDVWNAWKQKSSERLGLSLQLAAALEFDGFHRMSPQEVREAEDFASRVGGIDTLRAYVRAQWEVTQTIMAKAGENKIDVFRALMLPGDQVEQTSKDYLRRDGTPMPPPTNVKVEKEHLEAGQATGSGWTKAAEREFVTFEYDGEHFRVEKERKPMHFWGDVPDDIRQKVRDFWGARGAHINAAEVEKYKKEFDIYPDYNKLAIMRDLLHSRQLPEFPLESTEETIRHAVSGHRFRQGVENIYTKLPDLKLSRAGAQSTTGTASVANEWSGVGKVPDNAVRVVIRIEAPSTSVLSLPVYGKNIQEEHESVLMGTRDKWLWDAWQGKAPYFDAKHPLTSTARKGDSRFLVIDLQAEDRNRPHWMSTVNWSMVQSVSKFDEAKHPREAAGSSEGGQFTESGHSGVPTSTPELAEQAKVGIAAVEKLVDEAVDTADYEDIPGHEPDSWDDLDDSIKDKVREKWFDDAYNNSSGDVDTTELDREVRKEVENDNQEILDQAEKDTIEELTDPSYNPFKDLAPTLPVEGGEAFDLQRVLDPETFNYVDGDHNSDDDTVELDLEALRFKSGEPLTADEQQVVKDRWDGNYKEAFNKAIEKAFESDGYSERRSELENQAIEDEWRDKSNSELLTLAQEYGFTSSSEVEPGRPDNWVTGIEKGQLGDEDYGRTHAVALRLTELRMEEIRKERGLFGPGEKPAFTIEKAVDYTETHPNYVAKDISGKIVANSSTLEQATLNAEEWATDQSERLMKVRNDTLIRRVWTEWKQSSSESLGLSLQLAAARELGGVHRMTPEEVTEAENAAESQGGMKMLQAYVRAQWEVTQYVMEGAGETHLEVYRGLMLPGDEVDKSPHQHLDKMGRPPTSTNVQQGRNPTSGNPTVSFDFNGEHFVVERNVSFDFTTDEKGAAVVESVEAAMQRRIDVYLKGNRTTEGGILTKLPELQLQRAGAQSTTGTASVANGWNGVGHLPPNPVRVVLRIDAPSTSVLSLPVYGQNEQNEHESVLAGTKDKWLWDAWQHAAPTFKGMPMTTHARKADTKPLVIDLQAEDRGKPHWLSKLQPIAPKPPVPPSQPPPPFKTVLKWQESQHPRDKQGQFTEGTGHETGSESGQTTAQPHPGAGGSGGVGVPTPTPAPGKAPGRPEAVPEAQAVANAYNAAHGFPPVQHGYVTVDEARAGNIADAYDAMPDDDHTNPIVQEAYAALSKEVQAQWDHITASGVVMEPWTKEGQPYQSSTEMVEDVRKNKHLYFFTGGEPHPLLGAIDSKTGLSMNDKFRAVHDYFGHAAGGYGFGARGEENAWLSHSQMLSPAARRALTTETRGQNSWVNFGRQNYNPDGSYKHIHATEKPYAIQKVALLPDWYIVMPGETVLKYAHLLKWDRNQPRGPKGTHQGGRWVKDVSQGIVAPEDSNEAWATVPGMERGGGGASLAAIMNAPMGTGFKNPPRGEGVRVAAALARAAQADEALQARAEAYELTGMPQSPLLETLRTADAVSSKELDPGEHVNTVLKVKLNDPDGTKAVLKPEAGEGWTGSFANGDINEYVTNREFSLAEREALSFEVSEGAGLGLVPAVVHRTEIEGVDLDNLSSGGGGGYDSDDLRDQYDEYKEKADEQAIEAVGEEMSNLFDEHVQDINKRAEEVTDIWNELVDEYPDHAAEREHPTLPMGSQQPFERKVPETVDPYEILKEADVDMSATLNAEEIEKVRAALRQRLEAGAEELGDIDRNDIYDKEYDDWRQAHEDTENRLYQSKVQSFDSWKQSQGYGSNSGGGGAKNDEAPHPRGGSLQVWVEDLDSSGYPKDEEVRRLAVFDYLVGTMDRHPNNVSFDGDGNLLAMDNGYSFPDVNVADGFIFRSAPVRLWKKHKGQAQLMPASEREKIARAMEQTDWEALVARHPSMTPGERRAFLGRVENMKEALKTETGLRDLWSHLSVMN